MNNRILVLGKGPVAYQLAEAYRQLGFWPTIDTPQALTEVLNTHPDNRPALIAVAEEQVLDTEALETLEQLEQQETRVVPSSHACELATDREALRTKASEELGLPTLAYKLATTKEEIEQAAEEIGFPLILKPTKGRGQHVATTTEELNHPFGKRELMVERYIEFDYEVTILTVRSIDPNTGQLATWFCEPIGTRHEGARLVESWQPAPLTDAARDNARSIAARITGALGGHGLFAIELFVDGEEVYFSQATPLPGMDGLLTCATQRFDQCELFARASLLLPIDVTLTSPGASHLKYRLGDPTLLAKALSVDETRVQVLDGAVAAHATADTIDEARDRAQEALS
ncbi:ATP-grasp domain-containing protein [Corynebacterium riegelii]|uniref:ATP-grasp domain-containing protein n=1 Tax=Corynebacterium riegelii TaxID=156976 RepID=A0A0K1RDY3_9CORY|nr:ATP-grasp domain-containing protein [Corynebacterium riegelii]AKV59632.1 hypothetical protein AK829_11425 [Corynebacterium riegelii]